ncbi:MAG: hypothetical protein ABIW81_08440 [Terrimesophilobacter sp.]
MSEVYPDKFTPVEQTVVGEAASLLLSLGQRSLTIGRLFLEHKQAVPTATYDSFVTALTLLYGAVVLDYNDQILRAS